MKLSPAIIENAKVLRADGYSWRSLARKLMVSEHCVRCELDPHFRAYRIEQGRKYRGSHSGLDTLKKRARRLRPDDARTRVHTFGHEPPLEVMRERDLYLERMLEPREITAELLGDPGPGRSALDKRRSNNA